MNSSSHFLVVALVAVIVGGSIVHREMATAETMQHYLKTPGGSVCGFAPEGTIGQTFRRGPRTSTGGLSLASAYTIGGAFSGAMMVGAQAASQGLADARYRTPP